MTDLKSAAPDSIILNVKPGSDYLIDNTSGTECFGHRTLSWSSHPDIEVSNAYP